jgi:hypothetical protein
VVAHLDPGRRAALFDELANLGAQVWMTGPTLLRLPASGQAPTFSTSRPVRFRGGHNLKPQRNRPGSTSPERFESGFSTAPKTPSEGLKTAE